jgi:hypothetical protein
MEGYVVGCLRVRGRAALSTRGGQFARGSRTVREEPAYRVFVVFFACSCVSVFRSVSLGVFGREVFVGQSARGGRIVREVQTVRECSVEGPLLRVQYLWFGSCFWTVYRSPRTVHPGHAESQPCACRRSAWCCTELLSPLLLQFCFRFGTVWGLFLGLVGPCDYATLANSCGNPWL